MRTATFKSGIHPPQEKDNTSHKEIVIVPVEEGTELIYPLAQSIGAPCVPIVEKGEYVYLGQKIADTEAFVSAPIHASVSGTVKGFKKTVMPNGMYSEAIILEADGKNVEHESLNVNRNYKDLTGEEIIKIVREAGIVGMGGAGFPTHIKINPPPDKKIDTIILNGAECEPYLTNDYRVMLENSDWLLEGVKILLHIFKDAKGIIGIESNKMDAIKLLEEKLKPEDNIEVVSLEPKYPQGSEKHLIYSCTNREVPSGKLPLDINCIVVNVETAIAIQRAVVRGRPLMSRNVTLSGDVVKETGNYKIRLGTSYRQLVEKTGGLKNDPYKIVSGGPMMGVSLYTLDIPFIKTASTVLFLSEEKAGIVKESNCIRCGRCIEHCPMNLLPLELNQHALQGNEEDFIEDSGMDCIECGCCSYVCPAKRHLVQSIRTLRRTLLGKKK